MTVALEVENLHVVIADTDVDIVDEVSFSLTPGQILGLVGESGSGKTTVGLAILGHCRRGVRFAGGAVRIAGEDVLAKSDVELRSMRPEPRSADRDAAQRDPCGP